MHKRLQYTVKGLAEEEGEEQRTRTRRTTRGRRCRNRIRESSIARLVDEALTLTKLYTRQVYKLRLHWGRDSTSGRPGVGLISPPKARGNKLSGTSKTQILGTPQTETWVK